MNLFVLLVVLFGLSNAKNRRLKLDNDHRNAVVLSTYGFGPGGTLHVHLSNFTFENHHAPMGFTFSRGEEILEYTKSNPGQCFLTAPSKVKAMAPGIIFKIERSQKWNGMAVEKSLDGLRVVNYNEVSSVLLENRDNVFAANFRIEMGNELGYFVFLFHNCRDSSSFLGLNVSPDNGVSFDLHLVERNENSYFQVGDEHIPTVYWSFSAVFAIYFFLWTKVIYENRTNAYKIHYLMACVVLLKSVSVFFHGVDFNHEGVYGEHLEAWAIVYYIVHLIKGSMMFATIVLIGTGWTLFKNFLVERDRRLLMVIIPLQVLDNVALIVLSETEIGQANYEHWSKVFILFDLLCCGAVILPVIWSIKHLEQASQTDGKAAFSLCKLRLFRQFYIIIICYVYLTRIIKYLLQFTIPYNSMWIVTVIEETGSALLFLWTGVKFKPASNNPYLKLSQGDEEEDYALTQCGALEDVVFLSKKHSKHLDKDRERGTANDETL